MKKGRIYLIVQSILCIVLAMLLIAAVIGIYREGVLAKTQDPLAWVFSAEILSERLHPLIPLAAVLAGTTIVGLVLGLKDENAQKPVRAGKTRNKAPAGKMIGRVLLAAAVCLLAAGVLNGSAKDVFGKAVKICTECIGLG